MVVDQFAFKGEELVVEGRVWCSPDSSFPLEWEEVEADLAIDQKSNGEGVPQIAGSSELGPDILGRRVIAGVVEVDGEVGQEVLLAA